MRNYKCSPFGDIVDLDDSDIYNYLPKNTKELRNIMFAEIGMAYCYMDFWHKDFFHEDNIQRETIKKLVEFFTKFEKDNYNNIQWYQEQVFLFQDETENMC
jgi:hypothetical protein